MLSSVEHEKSFITSGPGHLWPALTHFPCMLLKNNVYIAQKRTSDSVLSLKQGMELNGMNWQ